MNADAAAKPSWWKDGLIYQIYPRSFADTNGDGIGDIPGIIGKLPYLQDLGVGGIWISPINTSPMADFGYDVKSYRDIDPVFGTHDDFVTLIADAHSRGIRVIMDMVFNHTSDEHPWFIESSSSRESEKRDWYVWHDGVGRRRKPPNNWLGTFGGKAWEWNEATRSYYLHSFVKKQPDLNWYNPEVRKAVYGEITYWLELGVDGFRFDVVNWFGHDRQFRSNPLILGPRPRPYDLQKHIYDRNLPVSHEALAEIRSVLDNYEDRMMVCEIYSEPPGDPRLSASYAGPDQAHMTFNFAFLMKGFSAKKYADTVLTWDTLMREADAWPCHVLSNHDAPRALGRFGRHARAKARVAAVMLLTLRGTPFLYYGEEIGMDNGRIKRSELTDPLGIRYWPFDPGRDPERTPMQWDGSTNGGFTSGTPWLPVNSDAPVVNVQAQDADPDSLLNLYRRLIRLRVSSQALKRGTWELIHNGSTGVFSYLRTAGAERKLVVLNFKNRPVAVNFPAPSQKVAAELAVVISTHSGGTARRNASINLAPYEAVILG